MPAKPDQPAFLAQIVDWLTAKLSDPRLGVAATALFGSVLRQSSNARDVDVVVVFSTGTDAQIQARALQLKKLTRDFRQCFAHELHVTAFAPRELKDMAHFLQRAGKHDFVISSGC
jgi:predicted nucleotidyltransferase